MNEIDFLPERIKHHRRRQTQLKRQGLLLSMCVMLLGLLAYANQERIQVARADLQAGHERQEALQCQINLVQGLTEQQARLEVKVRISQELGSRLDLTAVLAELSRLLPRSTSLTGLECTTVEIELPVNVPAQVGSTAVVAAVNRGAARAPRETRVRLTLTGLAANDMDVANFIGQMSGCPLFEDVNMGYSKTVDIDNQRRKARSFQVTCLLVR